MTLELEKVLPPALYDQLRIEAERQNSPVDVLIRDAVELYITTRTQPDEDASDEAILAGFEEGWRDIQEGRTTPADEAIAELYATRAARQQRYDSDQG
jgi:predicted transcriptional regulator